ncbi:GATA zinc finger domain-containing protein 14-like isoform X2 [Condylostylus longicornis]|nr:GATA zinc finger domain-containing protein 14-like isoform X2 [Condylostylus longicornis]
MEATQKTISHLESRFYPNQNQSRTLNNLKNEFDLTTNYNLNEKNVNKLENQQSIQEEIYTPYINSNGYYNNHNSHLIATLPNYEKSVSAEKKYEDIENNNYLDSKNIILYQTLDLTTTKVPKKTIMEYKSDLLVQTEIKYENDQGFYGQNYQNLYVKKENEYNISPTQNMQNFQPSYYNPFVIPPISQYDSYNKQSQVCYEAADSQISPQQIEFPKQLQQLTAKNNLNQNNVIYEETISQISPNQPEDENLYIERSIINNSSPANSVETTNIGDSKNISPHNSTKNSVPQLQSFEILKNKIEQRHQQKKANECRTCNKNFITPTQLKRHFSSSAHKNQILAGSSIILPNPNFRHENLFPLLYGKRKRTSSTDIQSDESLNDSNQDENKNQYSTLITSSDQAAIVSSTSNVTVKTENFENKPQNLQQYQYYYKNADVSQYLPYTTQNSILSTTQQTPNNNQYQLALNYQNYYPGQISNGIYDNFITHTSPYNYSLQNYSDNSTSPTANNDLPNANNQDYNKTTPHNSNDTIKIIANQQLIVPQYGNPYAAPEAFESQFNPSNQQVTPVFLHKSTDLMQISPTTSIISDSTILSQKYDQQSTVKDNVKNQKENKKNPAVYKRRRTNPANEETAKVKCIECNREFAKTCYLTQHNKTFHSGDTPHKCLKCGKRFHTEESLNIHTEKHITIDKPHKCDLCIKQFHHKTDLRRHRESHTGYNVHVCDLCNKGFSRRDHLRQHFETHFGTKVRGAKPKKKVVNPETIASYNETINTVSSETPDHVGLNKFKN